MLLFLLFFAPTLSFTFPVLIFILSYTKSRPDLSSLDPDSDSPTLSASLTSSDNSPPFKFSSLTDRFFFLRFFAFLTLLFFFLFFLSRRVLFSFMIGFATSPRGCELTWRNIWSLTKGPCIVYPSSDLALSLLSRNTASSSAPLMEGRPPARVRNGRISFAAVPTKIRPE